MAKKSTIQIEKMEGSYPPYNVYCNSETHDGIWSGAETLAEARELKKAPESWCPGCLAEKSIKNDPKMGRQF